VAVEKF